MTEMFTDLIGTLAIILVITEILSGSQLYKKIGAKSTWQQYAVAGIVGGLFGIYANLTGIEYNGAMITVRDTGPMIAGYIAGPFGGIIAGIICGIHRYFMGGITASACIAATCLIGFFSGFYFENRKGEKIQVWKAFWLGASLEMFHLLMVLLIVQPFDTALDIVTTIAIPFILVNALGFSIMIAVLYFIDQQKKMVAESGRVDAELETAKTIQRSLLPPINEEYPSKHADYKFDIAAYMEPAKKVGGDFYDFFFVGHHRFAFLIADVSGKGIPAALFMSTAKMTLQNSLRDFRSLPEAVQMANENLCTNNEAGMFVTAWIGMLDLNDMSLKYVSAGHNPPIMVHDGKAEYMSFKKSFILAGMEGTAYNENTIQLSKGDVIYLYTDGVSEASDKNNELFGEERLLKCLNKARDGSPDDIIRAVNKDVDKFVAGYEQFDDITMLAIKIN